jgi:starch synthase (maltosyl-transferring)
MPKGVDSKLPRVVIERVSPELDCGRHPIKKSVGDSLRIGADIYKDGHDLVSARVLYRGPGDEEWQHGPLDEVFEDERWYGELTLDRIGRWRYTIEAWPDPFRSWRDDLRKRIEASQDIASELLEGAALVKRRLRQRPAGAVEQRLLTAVKVLEDRSLSLEARTAAAFDAALLTDMHGPLEAAAATRYRATLEVVVERELAGFGAWYELFPRSQAAEPGQHGSFADTERRLPELAALGFDVIYLPPIHPIGRSYRKGRNNTQPAAPGDPGSPWAIGNEQGGHTAVHPELGTLDDFGRLVRSARELGMEIALDYALQCSPDHPWVEQHPEWFFVRPDGTIRYAENPPKKYQDIYPLDFWCEDWQALWNACRDVFLFWIDQGVTIFRVDNPHTKPFAFWEWVIGEVQREHPETIFLAEAFTRPKRMRALAKLGFTQSYSYFTWKNSAWELREYLTELAHSEMAEYYRPNFFANTPDILHEYLQHGGRPAFRIRLLLAATLAPVYGIYSGFELCENVPVRPGSEEYLNSEKYEIRQRNWNAPGNIRGEVARINRIRRENPALQRLSNLRFLHAEYEGILAYWKTAPRNDLIVVVNLDPHHLHESMIHVPIHELGIGDDEPYLVEDLLTGQRYGWRGARNYVRLDPSDRPGHLFRLVRSYEPL